MYDDKNCLSTTSVCDDKNCQPTKSVHMWPVKSAMKSNHMWSVEPALLKSTYKMFSQVSLCDDKNCQSTKKHSYEECQVRLVSLCNDKNCQSAKCTHMWTVKTAMPQSNYKMSSPKKSQGKLGVTQSTHLSRIARKQIGTQPVVTSNCQDSTSKHWYPFVSTNVCPDTVKMQSNHMWPVKLSSRSDKSTQGHKYRQANVKGILSP